LADADPIARLVHHLGRLPGVGARTARRLAFFLLADKGLAADLARALHDVGEAVGRCDLCGDFSPDPRCSRCADPRRDPTQLCVVERWPDLHAIDRSGAFRGRFHVLDGALSPLDGVGPDQLRVRELLARLDGVEEVILATNPTVEGDATALYLSRLLKALVPRVSRIARGIAVGAELEYTDQGTISRALEERREV
jgi:recombination protein RecR